MTLDQAITIDDDFAEYLRKRGYNDAVDSKSVRRGMSGEILLLETIWRAGQIDPMELADLVSDFFHLPRADCDSLMSAELRCEGLSMQFLRESYALPVHDGTNFWLALANPGNREAIDAVLLALGRSPRLCVLSFDEMELLFERAKREEHKVDAPRFAEELINPDSVEVLQDLARGAPIVRAIDQIMERALDVGATDIHFETGRDELRIRFRVDGLLRQDQVLPKHLAPAVISRVKILASLDIAERRLPQDGRANVRIGNVEADLRVALSPTIYGETAVARILLKDIKLLDFERIGMSVEQRSTIEALLHEPHGVIIVTGPTGSGKTTTLATSIGILNDPSRKIVTVEDPIEYQIAGVHQTQVKSSIGLTFATALRSFLRHDPDVIMVGEMRDGETAQIGIQAALTGHLVLTTLHTNSASDAVVRLTDMGVEPFLIAASLRGVLGQRLVRRLCDRCKKPDPEQANMVESICAAHHFVTPVKADYYKAAGCPSCGQTGFRGRVGVFEIMRASTSLRMLIGAKANGQDILSEARRGGMSTMLEDGLRKASCGLTCVDEILRTVG